MSSAVTTTVIERVAVIEMHRGPHNFFDQDLLRELAGAVLQVDEDPDVRSVVLCSEGKHFCAGADLRDATPAGIRRIYRHAFGLFTGRRPVVAAVQGAAIGSGLGLALAADFRVAGPAARFKRQLRPPRLSSRVRVDGHVARDCRPQRALELLYTGRMVSAGEALELGLCDRLVPDDPRAAAVSLAAEIAASAPLSVAAIRPTMRRRLTAEVHAALDIEAEAQSALLNTADFEEGLDAVIARRDPAFAGA
jgi:enoyl-CoA hydratase/carnithine racemase